MSRALKFRAMMNRPHDGHEGLWVYITGIGHDQWWSKNGRYRGDIRQETIGEWTGLLDRNGKEIFEGDRCNVQFADGTINRAEVVFEDGCFNLHFYRPVMIGQYQNVRDYLKCWTVNHAVEVIGNIYAT
jgi:hypothetical protein